MLALSFLQKTASKLYLNPLVASKMFSTDLIDTISLKERTAENLYIREKEREEQKAAKAKANSRRHLVESKHHLVDCYEFAENEEEETTLLNNYLSSPLNTQNDHKRPSHFKLPYEDMLNFAITDVDRVLIQTVGLHIAAPRSLSHLSR